ncbi:hypothetical protein GCM10011613_33090 [Cellvibrio zantedeschiae]|uniref:Uncharacterized protein n=1 Tax=Cellvibrio zantedeschiae TaxID=1237077 RepID=A0ABQ3B8X7_9GAMM|nr:hypothetical protein [Cellvibrio zantedeschiae]GGY85344.1 hypothetical protein GCM10011613_33090 [Cellvibrio zantedeschiae]
MEELDAELPANELALRDESEEFSDELLANALERLEDLDEELPDKAHVKFTVGVVLT